MLTSLDMLIVPVLSDKIIIGLNAFEALQISVISTLDIFDNNTPDKRNHVIPFIRRILVENGGCSLYKLEATIPVVESLVQDVLPFREKARKRSVTDQCIIHEILVQMERQGYISKSSFLDAKIINEVVLVEINLGELDAVILGLQACLQYQYTRIDLFLNIWHDYSAIKLLSVHRRRWHLRQPQFPPT